MAVWWCSWLAKYAKIWLSALLLSTLALALWRIPQLEFRADFSRLLEPGCPAQTAFERYRSEFGYRPEVAVIVHCSNQEQRRQAIDSLVARLQSDVPKQFEEILAGMNLPKLPSQALFFLDTKQLDHVKQSLMEQRRRIQALSTKEATPDRMLLLQGSSNHGAVEESLLKMLNSSFQNAGQFSYQSPWGPQPPKIDSRIDLDLGADCSVVIARPQEQAIIQLEPLESLIQSMRVDYPQCQFCLSGDICTQGDDARSAQRAAIQATVLSFLLVHFFFRWVFRESAAPRMAIATTLTTLLWASVAASFLYPVLNIISANFLATLIGLSMDFNIQLLMRQRVERQRCTNQEAWARSLSTVGRDNLVGALSTSAAFFSLRATSFKALTQLGTLSGTGILLAWILSMTVLPALSLWLEPNQSGHLPGSKPNPLALWLGRLSRWSGSRPKFSLALSVVLLVLAGLAAQRVRFDGNILHLQPAHSMANRSEEFFHEYCHQCSLDAVLIVNDKQTVASLKPPSGSAIELNHPDRWIPEGLESKRTLIESILEQVRGVTIPRPARLSAQQLLDLKAKFSREGANTKLPFKIDEDRGPGPIQDGLFQFESHLFDDLRQRVEWLQTQNSAEPPQLSDYPSNLIKRYRSSSGDWLVTASNRACNFEPDELHRFCQQLTSMTGPSAVTGKPFLIDQYLGYLESSYGQACRNALLAISVILVLHFRSLRLAGLAMLPKILGAIWMLGLMGILGVPFNPANSTALPLILGIGLVFGVHWLEPRPPADEDQGHSQSHIAGAIAVSGVSTVMGYASLLTTDYRGMASLGLVMAFGIGANLLAVYLVLPALHRPSQK
jgi:uncharacterized protein